MNVLCPPVLARSLPEANLEVVTLGHRAAVVSIGEPGTPLPYGFRTHNPLHLRLEFHDIVSELADGFRAPRIEDLRALMKHAPILRTANLVYCHCNAGISRSTAVAYILRCLWRGPGCEEQCLEEVFADRPSAAPNPLLVRIADELMARDGAMLAALDARSAH